MTNLRKDIILANNKKERSFILSFCFFTATGGLGLGKFDGIVILSDLDGTLLNQKKLHPRQLAAVDYFVENGGLFCPATGRAENFLLGNYPDLPLKSYCIVKNGTAIYDAVTQSLIWSCPLQPAVLERAAEIFRRFEHVTRVNFHLQNDMFGVRRDEPGAVEKILSLQDTVFKAVFAVDDGSAAEIAACYRDHTDFQYTYSADFLMEILPLGAGKGVCAQKIRALLGERARCLIGIGDYANDISLLQAVDIGVAVESDCKELRDYARWIAPPIAEHPVAWLIDKIEKELC